MNNLDIPRNFISVLAALVLALTLSAMPSTEAFAEEISTIDIQFRKSALQDNALQDRGALRRLLSDPQRDPQEQRQLDRALDGVLEELA
ncbi:MAG: hypothetical protein NUV50_11240 [Rhodospirillales bacterium]|nr:hypothetical protein [Rhodospirillales bacterium]